MNVPQIDQTLITNPFQELRSNSSNIGHNLTDVEAHFDADFTLKLS